MNFEQLAAMIEQYAQEGKDIQELRNDYTALVATGKTPLGLRQWAKSDKPLMEDFNEDNRILDESIRALQAESHVLDESFRALQAGKANIGAPKTVGLPLADGVSGSISYSKDDFGRVYIHLHVQATTAFAYQQVLATLPEGSRPANLVYFMMGNSQGGSTCGANWGVITGSGDIKAWSGADGAKSLVAQVSFLAR